MTNIRNELALVQGLPLTAVPQRQEPNVLTFKGAVAAVCRGRWLVVGTTLAGMSAGTWMGLAQPNSYVSEGSFIIRPGGEQIVIQVAPSTGGDKPQNQPPMRGNAEAILKSEEVLKRTVVQLTPAYVLAPYRPEVSPEEADGIGGLVCELLYSIQRRMHSQGAKEPRTSDAVLALRDALVVSAPRENEVLKVSMTGNHPERAQRLLETFMEEAQNRHLEVYSAQSSIREIELAAETAREASTKARHEVKEFLDRNELQSFDADLTLAQEQAKQTRLEAEAMRARLQSGQITLEALEARLTGLSPVKQVKVPVPVENPNLPVLRERRADLGKRLLEARGTLRSGDEVILALERQVREVDAQIAEEAKKPAEVREETRMEDNQEYLASKQSLREIQLKLVADREGLPAAQKNADLARQEAERLLRLQDDWLQLARHQERTKETLEAAEQNLALARRKSELDRKRISSLAILDRPNLPLIKEGPKRARVVVGGMLVGMLLGIVLLVARALTDTTIRSADDLPPRRSTRVLAAIPNLDSTSLRRHERMRVTSWH
jgi:uncharacterized protein involved in exopolysaccharide biosynthesis